MQPGRTVPPLYCTVLLWRQSRKEQLLLTNELSYRYCIYSILVFTQWKWIKTAILSRYASRWTIVVNPRAYSNSYPTLAWGGGMKVPCMALSGSFRFIILPNLVKPIHILGACNQSTKVLRKILYILKLWSWSLWISKISVSIESSNILSRKSDSTITNVCLTSKPLSLSAIMHPPPSHPVDLHAPPPPSASQNHTYRQSFLPISHLICFCDF